MRCLKLDLNIPDNQIFWTYISQQMLKRKILSSESTYFCINHDDTILNRYLSYLDEDFHIINETLKDKISIQDLLNGPIKNDGLRQK